MIYIRNVEGKGRGVFAQKRFTKGEMIENVPVIIIPDPQWELLNQTALGEYYFAWNEEASAFPLGFGVLYNHSDTPNADAIRNFEDKMIEVAAIRDIEIDEEITIHYVCPPWFEVVT